MKHFNNDQGPRVLMLLQMPQRKQPQRNLMSIRVWASPPVAQVIWVHGVANKVGLAEARNIVSIQRKDRITERNGLQPVVLDKQLHLVFYGDVKERVLEELWKPNVQVGDGRSAG
jgi:hypothetical protein